MNMTLEYLCPEKTKELNLAFEKLVNYIKSNKKLENYFRRNAKKSSNKLTVLAFEDAAGDHWFDSNPEEHGINRDEGHLIREYFQSETPKA